MAISNVQKFSFPDFANTIEIEENRKILENRVKDEYTGRDLKIASNILAKQDIVIQQNEYTQVKVEKIKQEYFEKGWNDCEKSHQKILKQEKADNITNILNKIETNITHICQVIERDHDNLYKDCINLSYEIATKLAGKLIDKLPNDVVLDFLERNLPLLAHVNNIKITVNPKNYEAINSYIENMKKDSAIKIDLIKNEKINIEDCEISWKNGLVKKDSKKLKNDLELIFKNNL